MQTPSNMTYKPAWRLNTQDRHFADRFEMLAQADRSKGVDVYGVVRRIIEQCAPTS